jgi:hypothetical protein
LRRWALQVTRYSPSALRVADRRRGKGSRRAAVLLHQVSSIARRWADRRQERAGGHRGYCGVARAIIHYNRAAPSRGRARWHREARTTRPPPDVCAGPRWRSSRSSHIDRSRSRSRRPPTRTRFRRRPAAFRSRCICGGIVCASWRAFNAEHPRVFERGAPSTLPEHCWECTQTCIQCRAAHVAAGSPKRAKRYARRARGPRRIHLE